MPAYMEMLVSHSPPAGFLADFMNRNVSELMESRSCRPYDSPRLYRPTTLSPKPLRKQYSLPIKMSQPKKSCLIQRSLSNVDEDTVDALQNLKLKEKKKVVFADESGLQLTQVKVMKEASCEPPIWSLQFLAQVTHGLISPVPTEQWTIEFRQPASEYLKFRETIEKNNVALENVIIKESESSVVGTVKVKNLSFEKEVFIRASWDSWKSQVDTFCTYSQIGNTNYTVHDTFSFKLTLPPNSRKLEFCVCYRTGTTEYWDNNNGVNYILTNRHQPLPDSGTIRFSLDTATKRSTSPMTIPQKGSLTKISPWSELNTWSSTHDSDSTPYCLNNAETQENTSNNQKIDIIIVQHQTVAV